MTLSALSRALSSIDIIDETAKAMGETSEIAVQLNRDQMFAGIRSDGSEITPKYRPLTQFLKSREGRPFDRVTLNDTGSFYRLTFLRITGNEYELDSTDDKSAKLKTKYGDKIFGLTPQSKTQWLPSVQSVMVRSIAGKTGLRVVNG